MKKAFYFTFLLFFLLAFVLVLTSCDLGLTPQTQNKNSDKSKDNNTEQDKLLEVRDTVGGQSLVITITKSKPNVSRSVIKSVASGNYYHITLGGTTISWGTVIVVASSGNIGFFPDVASPGGSTSFSGTLTANNEIKIETIPVKGYAISGVEAGVGGGKGAAKSTFDPAKLDEVLNPTPSPIIPPVIPDNPVTPITPVAVQRTLTITGIPKEFEGKYLCFEAGNNLDLVSGFVPDTEKNNNGDLDLLPAQIKNGKVELKIYSQIYTENEWTYNPYTGSGTFKNFWFKIYSSANFDGYEDPFNFYTSVTFNAASTTLPWPIQRTLTITNIPEQFEGKYMFFSAWNGNDDIIGFEAMDDNRSYILPQIKGGTVELKMYKDYSPYADTGTFNSLYFSIEDNQRITIAYLDLDKNITFNVADCKLDAKGWIFTKPPVDEEVTLGIINAPTKTNYNVGEKFDVAGLEVKVILHDELFAELPGSYEYLRFNFTLDEVVELVDDGNYIFSEEGEITVDIIYRYSYFEDDVQVILWGSLKSAFMITVDPDLSEPDARLTGTWIAEYNDYGGSNEYSYTFTYTLEFTTAHAFTMAYKEGEDSGSLKGTYTVNSNNVVVLRGRNKSSDWLSGVVNNDKIVFNVPGLPNDNLVFTRQ